MKRGKNNNRLEKINQLFNNLAREIGARKNTRTLLSDFQLLWDKVSGLVESSQLNQDFIAELESKIASLKLNSRSLKDKLHLAKISQDNSRAYLREFHTAQSLAWEIFQAADVEAFGRTYCEIMKKFVSVGEAAVYGIENNHPLRIYPAEVCDGFENAAALLWEEGVVGWALEENRTVVVGGMADLPSNGKSYGYLLTPLAVRGYELGCYLAVSTKPERDYSSEEFEIADFLAGQAAESLRNIFLNAELKSTKEFLESLVENSQDLIISFNKEGIIVFANRAVSLYGYTPRELIGQPLTSILDSGQDISEFQGIPSQPKKLEMRIKSAQGKILDTICTLSTHRNLKGEIQGGMGVFKDVTDFKRQEERIIEAERLASVIQTAITVNHEVNNPLAVVMGNIYLAQERARELGIADMVDQLEAMERSCRRIRDITQKLQNLQEAATTDYIEGIKMIDIRSESNSKNGKIP